jgi:hypothetical protein
MLSWNTFRIQESRIVWQRPQHQVLSFVHLRLHIRENLKDLLSQTCPLHVFMHLQHFNNAFKVKCYLNIDKLLT